MSTGSSGLRRFVAARADHLCEYCLIHAENTYLGGHIDHVISEKHGGKTQEDNLAFACIYCNLHKGSDIASIVPETGELVPLFNPRKDRWGDHFHLAPDGITILPLTPVGEVTVRVLQFNESPRLLERKALQEKGRYPMPAAKKRL